MALGIQILMTWRFMRRWATIGLLFMVVTVVALSMTEAELLAGLDALNKVDPPTVDIPVFAGNTRHGCTKARLSGLEGREISTALEVKEMYVYGWGENEHGIYPILEDDGSELAIIYKQGRCRNRCGFTGRSSAGRVVRVEDRPPMQGRVARD